MRTWARPRLLEVLCRLRLRLSCRQCMWQQCTHPRLCLDMGRSARDVEKLSCTESGVSFELHICRHVVDISVLRPSNRVRNRNINMFDFDDILFNDPSHPPTGA